MTDLTNPNDLSAEELARRRTANRRIGWALALVALAIFVASMLARS